MAYDEGLAERVRTLLGDDGEVGGRKMFGGLAEDDDLRSWVDRGLAYAGSLPPK